MNEKKWLLIMRLVGNLYYVCSIFKFLFYFYIFFIVLKVYLLDYNVGKEGVILFLFFYWKKNEVFILIFFFIKIKFFIVWNICICFKLEKF